MAAVCFPPPWVFWFYSVQFSDISGYLRLGTYEGSHTWFEAFAERPLSIPAVQSAAPLPNPTDISDEANLQELQSSDGNPLWETVTTSVTAKGEDGIEDLVTERKTWSIQKNVHAESSFKEHEIIWTWSDNDRDKSVQDGEVDSGAGKGGDFVRSLKPGYRIRIAARAMVGHLLDPRAHILTY